MTDLNMDVVAAKVACRMVKPDMSALLATCQLGFEVRGGIEAAIHAVRHYFVISC